MCSVEELSMDKYFLVEEKTAEGVEVYAYVYNLCDSARITEEYKSFS